jgi:hypothetical protein
MLPALCAANIVRPRHPASLRRPRRSVVATAHLCVHERVSRGKGGSIVRTAAYNARE